MAAYRPYGPWPRLEVFTAERTWDSYDLLGFLGALPPSSVPRVVVLDNVGLHTGHAIRAAREGLAAAGIYLSFLLPYTPELNEIEPVFRQVKYQEMPQRSYTSRQELRAAVETAFMNYSQDLKSKSKKKPRRAAERVARRDARGDRTGQAERGRPEDDEDGRGRLHVPHYRRNGPGVRHSRSPEPDDVARALEREV
jgi:transposase